MSQVARAANVSRGTLYRHFPSRADLLAAVSEHARSTAVDDVRGPPAPRGRAGARDADAAVGRRRAQQGAAAPARRADRRRGAADRRRPRPRSTSSTSRAPGCMRLAGPTSFPETLPSTLAVGTEIPREGLPALRGDDRGAPARRRRPRRSCCVVAPWGVVVAVGSDADGARATSRTRRPQRWRSPRPTPTTSTPPVACGDEPGGRDPAEPAAAPDRAHERRARSPATCCPATRSAATGSTTPRTPTGPGSAMADAEGSGTRAAALGVRRARRVPLRRATRSLGPARDDQRSWTPSCASSRTGTTVTTTIGFWVPPTSTFSWISCGELGPIVVDGEGEGDLLEGHRLPPLGAVEEDAELVVRGAPAGGRRPPRARLRRVVDRAYPEGNALSIEGVVDAVRDAPFASAAGAVSAVEAVIHDMSADELARRRDDRGADTRAAVMSAIAHRLIDVPAGRIHVAEQGSGPLVLLVHGFPESLVLLAPPAAGHRRGRLPCGRRRRTRLRALVQAARARRVPACSTSPRTSPA